MTTVEYAVGETIVNPDDLHVMPVGTVIATENGRGDPARQYMLHDDERWHNVATGRAFNPDSFSAGCRIESYPDGITVVAPTATRFMWRFRNMTLRAQRNHGVSETATLDGLTAMGCDMDHLPLFVGLRIENHVDVHRLPVGTRFSQGVVSNTATYGLFETSEDRSLGFGPGERGLIHLFGRNDHANYDRPLTIEALPPDYVPPVVADDSQAGIDAFKVRAYLAGLKVKRDQDWCTTYDNIVARMGISPDVRSLLPRNALIDTKVRAVQASELPPGTLLSWSSTEGHSACAWFVRDDTSTNRAKTRRVFGHADEGTTGRPGNLAESMTVAWIPQEGNAREFANDVQSLNVAAHWDLLPTGTVLSWRGGEHHYVMSPDHRVTQISNWRGNAVRARATGDYRMSSFSQINELRVAMFGGQ